MRACAICLVLVAAACARPAHRLDFDRQVYEAERLADRGRFEEAAASIGRLADLAYLETDRVGLHVRAADLHIRRGALRPALLELAAARRENLDRGQAALIRLRYARMADRLLGRPDRARRMYLSLIEGFPDTVAARLALRDSMVMLARAHGPEAWMSFLEQAVYATGGTALRQVVAVHLARAKLRAGDSPRALDILEDIHLRSPSSSVWHSATQLLVKLHRDAERHEAEAEALDRLISRFETSTKPGTYDSPLYTQGELRLASLYCEVLDRPAAGAAVLERFGARHPSSRLRDDALWQLAACRTRLGGEKQRWKVLCRLLAEHPLSKWARKAKAEALELGRPLDGGRCAGPAATHVSKGESP